MAWKERNILLEENALDRHIHLHIHEIMPGRWLLARRGSNPRLLLRVFCGLLLSIGIIGFIWYR